MTIDEFNIVKEFMVDFLHHLPLIAPELSFAAPRLQQVVEFERFPPDQETATFLVLALNNALIFGQYLRLKSCDEKLTGMASSLAAIAADIHSLVVAEAGAGIQVKVSNQP